MKLQPLTRVPANSTAGDMLITCAEAGCTAEVRYRDAQETWYVDVEGDKLDHYCPEHSKLEDLDPEDWRNRSLLHRVPVRSNMFFQDVQSLDELMTIDQYGSRMIERRFIDSKTMWLCLPSELNRPLIYIYVKPTAKLEEVVLSTIYGGNQPYDHYHYVQVNKYGDDEYLISLKYQHIIGSRYICRVPRQVLDSFLAQVV